MTHVKQHTALPFCAIPAACSTAAINVSICVRVTAKSQKSLQDNTPSQAVTAKPLCSEVTAKSRQTEPKSRPSRAQLRKLVPRLGVTLA